MISICIKDEDEMVYGLKQDGTIKEYFPNRGNAALEDFVNLDWVDLVIRNESLGILGKTKDGRLLYYGTHVDIGDFCRNTSGEAVSKVVVDDSGYYDGIGYLTDDGTWHMSDAMKKDYYRTDDGVEHTNESWMPSEEIAQVVQIGSSDYAFLMKDGSVKLDVAYSGREMYDEVAAWKDIVAIDSGDFDLTGLTKDGTVVSNGIYFDDKSQSDIVTLGHGWRMMFAVKEDGTVVNSLCEDNSGRNQVNGWRDIVQVSGGKSHTVGLRKDGTVVAVGKNHCGQCDVEDWKDIIFITARNNCTLGITKDGALKMAGSLD